MDMLNNSKNICTWQCVHKIFIKTTCTCYGVHKTYTIHMYNDAHVHHLT